jgi:Tfp pilus assembly protein PilV
MMSGCVNLPRHSDGKKGMTILEVVIALGVFMIASAGICVLITQAKRLSDNSREHYQAVNIGKNRLERARFLPVSTLPLLVESNEYVNVSGANVDEEDANFRRSTAVVVVSSNLTEVIVTVDIRNRATWDFGTGTNGIREVLRTYFTTYYTP